MSLRKALVAGICVLALGGSAQAAEEVEVLHWWTSGGEAAALQVLKKNLEAQGVTWKDVPIAGGSGVQAMTALRARVAAGNPPTAVQMLGFDIVDWSETGNLASLNELAAKEGWEKVVPKALQAFSRHEGDWIAAPVNVHSTNWIWANKAVLDKVGITPPKTWDELITALDKVKAAGLIPLAHGGEPWQEATIFDSVVLTTGGADFYKKALLEHDAAALDSDTMTKVFERMAKLRTYVDPNFPGREWNLASAMVIRGEAAFQIMGDWAKGEFIKAKKKPGEDFLCFRFPGTQGSVTFNSDQFVAFKVGEERRSAQIKLASAVMDPEFQVSFNVVKGSVPARTDVPDTEFDACGKKAMADLKEAAANGTLLGSLGHGHAARAAVKQAMFDVITKHFNGQLKTADAAKALVTAVNNAK